VTDSDTGRTRSSRSRAATGAHTGDGDRLQHPDPDPDRFYIETMDLDDVDALGRQVRDGPVVGFYRGTRDKVAAVMAAHSGEPEGVDPSWPEPPAIMHVYLYPDGVSVTCVDPWRNARLGRERRKAWP